MTNFTLSGYGGTYINDTAPLSDAGYVDRTGVVDAVELQPGGSYGGTETNNYSQYMNTSIWIDFNDNGVFESPELVTAPFGYTGSFSYSFSYTMTLPLTISSGYHRMRVRNIENGGYNIPDPVIDACNYNQSSGGTTYYNYSGQAWDYEVNIIPLPSCSGTPVSGIATATPGLVCTSNTFALNLSGLGAVGSLSFQWQWSPDSLSWAYISGATTGIYTTTQSSETYYRCVVLCTASGDSAYSGGMG